MDQDREITGLEQLLDRVEEAAHERDRVSLDVILEMVGRRTFGPLLLLAGLVTLAPVIGDIPGVPTIIGIFTLTIAGQLLLRREYFWLPRWLLRRSVEQHKLCKALKWMRRPARFIDTLLRQRLTFLIQSRGGSYSIALICALVAVAMPLMEVVPFSANGAGAALAAFGLALIAQDGLLALFAFVFAGAGIGLAAFGIL